MTEPNELTDNRLVQTFAEHRQADRRALLPFLTACYPDAETTVALLREIESRGARICELGIPFSDPIADGPTIQASYTEALASGVRTPQVLQAVRDYRAAGGWMAMLAMVSYSIVYRHHVGEYLDELRAAGFDATIIPDLSLEEAAEFEARARSAGLANVTLISPTTPPRRRRDIAAHATGFIYYMSIAGITGERTELPASTIDGVAELRNHTDTPICVGFGISNAEMVRAVVEVADGAIVGSAIVRRIAEHADQPRQKLVADVGAFVGELLAPVT